MKKRGTILIIDDEEDILFSLKFLLKQHFKSVFTEQNPYHLPRLIRTHEPDVILLDMNFGAGRDTGKEGLEWIQKIKELHENIPIVCMTAYGDVSIAVQALKSGAKDFVEKPWINEKLVATLSSVFEYGESEKKVQKLQSSRQVLSDSIDKPYLDIIGESAAMKQVFKTIDKVAGTDANVLILGENGTGKELIARAIHRRSDRASNVFIPVDLGAIPESLFESEIFGHKKGSFTGAHQNRVGRFEAANEGTLFLDEIGNLPLPSQSKLLQALQNREIVPVGANRSIAINIRLICATNMPLYSMVQEGTFRQDLLYRINTVEVQLPSLKDREGDIELLANFYLAQYARKYNKPELKIDRRAITKLESYHWPGNVRELRHIIERGVIMAEQNIISDQDLVLSNKGASDPNSLEIGGMTIDELEEKLIRSALKKYKGNISKAAAELGLTRTSLYRRLEKYGI